MSPVEIRKLAKKCADHAWNERIGDQPFMDAATALEGCTCIPAAAQIISCFYGGGWRPAFKAAYKQALENLNEQAWERLQESRMQQ